MAVLVLVPEEPEQEVQEGTLMRVRGGRAGNARCETAVGATLLERDGCEKSWMQRVPPYGTCEGMWLVCGRSCRQSG